MDYLKLKGSHYEIGKLLGKFLKSNFREFKIKLNNEQYEHGIKSLNILNETFPEVIEEIKAVTEEIDFDYKLFGAWLMCMGSCLTIRENHNVEIRGCTAFAVIDDEKVYYGRNNDLPPYLKEVSKTITYDITNKHKFTMNTSSFINGEEGINEHGLVVAMTFVMPYKSEVCPGINSVFLVRYLLEQCNCVNSALNELKKVKISSSCNILLVDKNKEMIVVECSPFGINIQYPEKNIKNNNFIVTVNHFTTKEMQKYDRSNQNIYSSKKRYQNAYEALKNFKNENSKLYIKDILKGKYGFMCQYKRIKFGTIWSTIFDIESEKMYLSDGNPEIIEYKEIIL